MTYRKGYDSTSPADCPDDGDVYCGYKDAPYAANYREQVARHPHAAVFSVTQRGSEANFADVENGDLTIADAVDWCKTQYARGRWFGIYCNASTWHTVQVAIHNAGLTAAISDHYWIASYPGAGATVPAGAVGHQYEGSPGNSPGHYDVSVWVDHIPGLDAAPKLKPARLSVVARHHARRLTDDLGKRKHPVADPDRVLLRATVRQINRALGLK